MITLYGNFLSRATRCLWMLEELGVAYENVPIAPPQAATVAPHNPNCKVPCLVDGEYKLFESMAINLYLAHKFGKAPFWPASPEGLGLVYQWSFWGATEVEPSLVAMLVERVFKPQGTGDAAIIANATEKLGRPLQILDDSLVGKDWLLGECFSAADLNLASIVYLLNLVAFETGPLPRLRGWIDRCKNRPAWKKAHGG